MSDSNSDNVLPTPPGPTLSGVDAIKAALATMPGGPGVYRMIAEDGAVLYVGKARSLKKRVTSYTQYSRLPARLQRMVEDTRRVEVVTTHTESEALLLESNFIKRMTPRFNVQLRDDKSFPYVALFEDHAFPQIAKHRGARDRKGTYFGPFASAGAVNETLTALQRAFLLRSCADTVFAGRTRPCLLYQIKRCSGPCAGRISGEDYATLVRQSKAFLSGHSNELQSELATKMQTASVALDYELAAIYRDRIRALTNVQQRQGINLEALGDADVIAAHQAGGQTGVQVFFFRGGFNYGNRDYYPKHDKQLDITEVLNAFIGQFYAERPAPDLILLSHDVPDRALLIDALSTKAKKKVRIEVPTRGLKRQPVEHALSNARASLARRMAEGSAQAALLEGVAGVFKLDASPERIEVYDNSHISGTQALGGMIVAGPEGFMKNAYRKFNIRAEAGQAPGDDYAMMREVLTRRFGRALREDPNRETDNWPDLVLVDGGLGQLNAARQVFADLGVTDVALVGIAKGPDRDAGRETFFQEGREPYQLDPRDPVLYFLQRLRDEAHRFAIGGHRTRRSMAIAKSPLDEIMGIGPRRKKALLLRFGSGQAVSRAGLADLESVDGISKSVAKKIYDHFHGEG